MREKLSHRQSFRPLCYGPRALHFLLHHIWPGRRSGGHTGVRLRRVANRLRPVSGRVPLQPARLGYRRSVPGTGGDLASVGAGGPCRGDGCGVDRAGNSENSKSYSAGRGGNNPEKRLAPAPESKKPLSRDMTVTALWGQARRILFLDAKNAGHILCPAFVIGSLHQCCMAGAISSSWSSALWPMARRFSIRSLRRLESMRMPAGLRGGAEWSRKILPMW